MLRYFYKLRHLSSLLLLIIFSFGSLSVEGAQTYPDPTPYKYLNDYAGVVTQNDANKIINIGRELEQKTGAQLVVVTLTSLKGVPIASYTNGLFRSWGIGQSGQDNGLLLLLSINDKAWRVEVGRGLEGAIPDILSSQIVEQLAKPAFINGDYGTGLASAYEQFSTLVAEEYGVSLEQTSVSLMPPPTSETSKNSIRLPMIGIAALLLIDLIFNRGRIFSFILQLFFWNNFFGGGRGGGSSNGGGGFGGFRGGSSNGGGSSGNW